MTTPLQATLNDPSVHFFVKRMLILAGQCDPVDALHDLELALEIWTKETDRILAVDKFTEELHKVLPEGE
jgi:hypothetical protein